MNPTITHTTILASLRATTDADAAITLAGLLRGGNR